MCQWHFPPGRAVLNVQLVGSFQVSVLFGRVMQGAGVLKTDFEPYPGKRTFMGYPCSKSRKDKTGLGPLAGRSRREGAENTPIWEIPPKTAC